MSAYKAHAIVAYRKQNGDFKAIDDLVKVKVIEIKDDKISLSIKALMDDPWKAAAAKYKKDQRVEAALRFLADGDSLPHSTGGSSPRRGAAPSSPTWAPR